MAVLRMLRMSEVTKIQIRNERLKRNNKREKKYNRKLRERENGHVQRRDEERMGRGDGNGGELGKEGPSEVG